MGSFRIEGRQTMIRTIGACSTLVLGSSLAQAVPVVFSDGVFAPASWNASTVTNAAGVGSTTAETQFLAGGNPAEYRRIEIGLNAIAPGGSVFSLNFNANAFYDPTTQGPVSSINYSEDARNFQPSAGGDIQGGGLLIVQGGSIFVQRTPLFVVPNPGFADWAAQGATLLATDLWELTPTGLLDSSTNPDFSATGGVMQLGFWRGGSSGNFVGTDFRDAGIDNWRVVVVPAPAGAGLLAVASLAALRRRR